MVNLVANRDKIVNGIPASAGDFPYMVRKLISPSSLAILYVETFYFYCFFGLRFDFLLFSASHLVCFVLERLFVWRNPYWTFPCLDCCSLFIRVICIMNLFLKALFQKWNKRSILTDTDFIFKLSVSFD